jgi:hypothetical protein
MITLGEVITIELGRCVCGGAPEINSKVAW